MWMDLQDGIASKFSMGVEMLDVQDLAQQKGEKLVRVAKRWRPYEISIAPVPADFGTTTLRSPGGPGTLESSNGRRKSLADYQREIDLLRLQG